MGLVGRGGANNMHGWTNGGEGFGAGAVWGEMGVAGRLGGMALL